MTNPQTKLPATPTSPNAGEDVGRDWLDQIKLIFADIFGDLNAESNNPIVPLIGAIICLIFYVGM